LRQNEDVLVEMNLTSVKSTIAANTHGDRADL